MGNVSRFKIIKLYWLDEPFGQGVDEKGHYIVFRLDLKPANVSHIYILLKSQSHPRVIAILKEYKYGKR